MPRPLKVFRTAVGFRDAYVAAPSKAAALRAWGTGKDLFARGAAEEVTDPDLMREALGTPGEVVYRTRGGLEEQVAALGKLPTRTRKPAAKKPKLSDAKTAAPAKPVRPTRPRPSREAVETAEAALAALQAEQDRVEAELQERERALADERRTVEQRFAKRRETLQREQHEAQRTYKAALDAWEP